MIVIKRWHPAPRLAILGPLPHGMIVHALHIGDIIRAARRHGQTVIRGWRQGAFARIIILAIKPQQSI